MPAALNARLLVGAALVLGACGGSTGSNIDAGANPTGSQPTVAVTTVTEPTSSTTAAIVPSTTESRPPTSLTSVDITELIGPDDIAELAQLTGPILLPTELPVWTVDADFSVATNFPALDNYHLSWGVYTDGEVKADVLDLGIDRADPQVDYELPTAGSVQGTVRTYSLFETEGEPCDGTGGTAVLAWEDEGYRYDVSMFPRPDCPDADVDALQQAVGVADSLQQYEVVDGELVPVTT
jgi:hypothetical protein